MSDVLLLIGAIYNLAFIVFHLLFWRLFDWENDLASLTTTNRAIMQVMNLSLTFAFITFGSLSLLFPQQMVDTELGRALTGMIATFWLLRAFEQVIYFKLKHWLSRLFTLVFLAGAGLYGLVLIGM
jgi:hypothetical protein